MGPVEQLDRALDFEGLIELADETIEQSMREIDQRDLVIALKGVSSAVREKFLCNMSERVQVFISEEVGLVRCEPGQILDSQARIVMHMYKMAEQGKIQF
jgi:flagellar motor switch protein FliG